MNKKNLQPQQQKPVVRPTVAKPIVGLSKEQLTVSWSGAAITTGLEVGPSYGYRVRPFAGDDAE